MTRQFPEPLGEGRPRMTVTRWRSLEEGEGEEGEEKIAKMRENDGGGREGKRRSGGGRLTVHKRISMNKILSTV